MQYDGYPISRLKIAAGIYNGTFKAIETEQQKSFVLIINSFNRGYLY